MKGTIIGTLAGIAEQCRKSPQAILEILSALTVDCTAQSEGPGLTVPYSVEFLKKQCVLAGARLAVNFQDEIVAGFALYHLRDDAFPTPLEKAREHFGALGRLGYGQLVAVRPNYRGAKLAIYDELTRRALEEARASVHLFLALVRDGNEPARAAHIRRGWARSGVAHSVNVEGKVFVFEYLLLNPEDPRRCAENVSALRELARAIEAPYSLRVLDAAAPASL